MKLSEALNALAAMHSQEGVDGDTELLNVAGFVICGFVRREFDEDDKELNCKKGDVVIEVISEDDDPHKFPGDDLHLQQKIVDED